MKGILRLFLTSQKKCSGKTQKTGGFTLIELLVAMILAVLVIGPLLGFMISILDTDRKEQAKSNSEQEIRAALDYIAQDLQQAVYIYDADGLSTNNEPTGDTTKPSGIKNQIPPFATNSPTNCQPSTCMPVLVFWKREFVKQAIPVSGGSDDTFVYSLVGYYLIKDNNATWSPTTARIARFQIQDGVIDPTTPKKADGSPNYAKDVTGQEQKPSPGFKPFDLTISGDLKQKMNRWAGNLTPTYPSVNVLVDYVDQTTNTAPAPVDCSIIFPPNPEAAQADQNAQKAARRVPPDTINTLGIKSSFYACVDSDKVATQVFIRGNALARIQGNATWTQGSVYFPTASIQVQGRSFLDTK